MLTLNDFQKIEEYFKQNAYRDSDFDYLEAVLGTEEVPVITELDSETNEKQNVLMTTKQFADYVYNESYSSLLTELTEHFDNYIDSEIYGGSYIVEGIDGKAGYNYDSLSHGYVDYNTGELKTHDLYRRFSIPNNGFIKVNVRSCNPSNHSKEGRTIAALAFLYADGTRRCVVGTEMILYSSAVKYYDFNDIEIPDDVIRIYVVARTTNTKSTVNTRLDNMIITFTQRVVESGIGKDVEDLLAETQSLQELVNEMKPEYMKLKYRPLLLSQEISSVDKEEVPSYFFVDSEADSIGYNLYYLENKLMNLPKGKHFIFITDTHWKYNTKKSLGIILYVRKRANIPYVVFGGDAIHRPCNVETETSPGIWSLNGSLYVQDTALAKQKIYDELREFMIPVKEKFGNKFLPVYGNHDRGLANLKASNDHYTATDITNIWLPYADYVKMAHSSICENVTYDEQGIKDLDVLDITDDVKADLTAAIKLSYYTDDTLNKIRFIVVNTGIGNTRTTDGVKTYFDGVYQDVFGLASSDVACIAVKFVARALLSLPEDYDVVLAGHWFTQYKEEYATHYQYRNGGIYLQRVIYAYLRGNASFDVPVRGDTKTAYTQWLNATPKIFDFSTANKGRVLVMQGHRHVNAAHVLTYNTSSWTKSTSTRYIATLTIIDEETLEEITAPLYPYNEDDAARLKLLLCIVTLRDGVSGSVPTQTATGGTIETDCSFDIVTITDDNRVFCTRIGAGIDRELVLPNMTPDEFYQLYPPPVPPEPPVDPDDPDEDEDEDEDQPDHITVIGDENNILVVQGIDQSTMDAMADPTQTITETIDLIMPDNNIWTVYLNVNYAEYYCVKDSNDTTITDVCTVIIDEDDQTKLELVAPADIDFTQYLTI